MSQLLAKLVRIAGQNLARTVYLSPRKRQEKLVLSPNTDPATQFNMLNVNSLNLKGKSIQKIYLRKQKWLAWSFLSYKYRSQLDFTAILLLNTLPPELNLILSTNFRTLSLHMNHTRTLWELPDEL